MGHSTAGFSILSLSGKRATNLFCDTDNFETCIYSVRPEQSNILMLYKRLGPDLMVHWWLMVLLFLVVAVAANALALLPTHCAPSFLRLSHFGLRATFCVCHLDLERSPCSSQLLPKLDLEHLFCCNAINSPGNVEGALLAAFGHLILCPPCESTAVGQHSRSNKIIQIASYLRLQKLYYYYFFYF